MVLSWRGGLAWAACVSALLAQTKNAPGADFSTGKIVDLWESLIPEPEQMLEPVGFS